MELVPSEFKKLPLAYLEIDKNKFNNFTTEFENKKNVDDILVIKDFNILNTTLGLNINEIEKIERIRLKLLNKSMSCLRCQ